MDNLHKSQKGDRVLTSSGIEIRYDAADPRVERVNATNNESVNAAIQDRREYFERAKKFLPLDAEFDPTESPAQILKRAIAHHYPSAADKLGDDLEEVELAYGVFEEIQGRRGDAFDWQPGEQYSASVDRLLNGQDDLEAVRRRLARPHDGRGELLR